MKIKNKDKIKERLEYIIEQLTEVADNIDDFDLSEIENELGGGEHEMTLSEQITKRIQEIIEYERTNLPNEYDNWNVVRDNVEWNGYEWRLELLLHHKKELDVLKYYKTVPLNKRK